MADWTPDDLLGFLHSAAGLEAQEGALAEYTREVRETALARVKPGLEAVARIIDPDAWLPDDLLDDIALSLVMKRLREVDPALSEADVVLALFPGLTVRGVLARAKPDSAEMQALIAECDLADAEMRKWVRVPVKYLRTMLALLSGRTDAEALARVKPDRETVARIIDPDAWLPVEEFREEYGEERGLPWHEWQSSRQKTSLTRADAVLALLPGPTVQEVLDKAAQALKESIHPGYGGALPLSIDRAMEIVLGSAS